MYTLVILACLSASCERPDAAVIGATYVDIRVCEVVASVVRARVAGVIEAACIEQHKVNAFVDRKVGRDT